VQIIAKTAIIDLLRTCPRKCRCWLDLCILYGY